MNLYYIGNHRSDEQLREMKALEREGICLFCPEHLATRGHAIIERTDWWVVTPNRFPYAGTQLHLLLVPHQHVDDLADLPEQAIVDLWRLLRIVRAKYDLRFYGLGVRCGDCRFTGGTITHLHLHLIVGDVTDPAHQPVRLKLSSRPLADDQA